jgi:hypothetical protein
MKTRPLDLKPLRGVRTLLLGAICAASVLGVAGCSIGPDYVRPSVTVPAAFKENGGAAATGSGALSTTAGKPTPAPAQATPGWTSATPADTDSRGEWWTRFGDPQLNTLEASVSVSNQTIQKAVAQLQEARAMVESAHAAYLPTVGVEADGSRLHDSQYLFGHQQTAGKSYNDYAVALDASWEPDLWGKIAHENDAARAGAQASAADLESVRLSVHAELAVDYFNLRGLDASKQLLDQTIADYQQTLDQKPLHGRRIVAVGRHPGRDATAGDRGAGYRPWRRPGAIRARHRHADRRSCIDVHVAARHSGLHAAGDARGTAFRAAAAAARYRRRGAARGSGQ